MLWVYRADVVLQNLDGFIALIAIIGGVANSALQTVLRMWESEQQIEIDDMPVNQEHKRTRHTAQHEHMMGLEDKDQTHRHTVEKHEMGVTVLRPVVNRENEEGEWIG